MNAFELGKRKVIPSVLVYVHDGCNILMMEKTGDSAGVHAGKWNGLGGKCEPGESFWAAATRELREESGIDVPTSRLKWMGQLHFPGFKAKKCEDWLTQVFTLELFGREREELGEFPLTHEGRPKWVQIDDVLSLPLWEGDREFLPMVFEGRCFLGTFWYMDGALESYELWPI